MTDTDNNNLTFGGRRSGPARRALRGLLLLGAIVFLSPAFFGARPCAADPPHPTTIVVFGDSQAAGVAGGLQRILVEDAHYRVLNRTHTGAALVNAESEWLGPISRFLAREKADIAVVMMGANDRLDMRDEHGANLRFRSDEWGKSYAARVDKMLTVLTKASLKVIWCGNPIARSETYSADMRYLNDIFAGEAKGFGAQFLSLWDAVVDDQGHYTAYGKGQDGTTQRLRADDGNHFTVAGYEVVAKKIVDLLPASEAKPH